MSHEDGAPGSCVRHAANHITLSSAHQTACLLSHILSCHITSRVTSHPRWSRSPASHCSRTWPGCWAAARTRAPCWHRTLHASPSCPVRGASVYVVSLLAARVWLHLHLLHASLLCTAALFMASHRMLQVAASQRQACALALAMHQHHMMTCVSSAQLCLAAGGGSLGGSLGGSSIRRAPEAPSSSREGGKLDVASVVTLIDRMTEAELRPRERGILGAVLQVGSRWTCVKGGLKELFERMATCMV